MLGRRTTLSSWSRFLIGNIMRKTIIYHSYSSKVTRPESGEKPHSRKLSIGIKSALKNRVISIIAQPIVKIRKRLLKKTHQKRKTKEFTLPSFYAQMARAFAGFSFIILIVSYGPSIWYETEAFLGGDQTSQILAETVDEEAIKAVSFRKKPYQPEFDPNLPMENSLSIFSIGVDTQIAEATLDNYEEALKKGAWRVSDFGTPRGREMPTILAAHRYGYLRWTNSYRRKNSFFNLPKLNIGDKVEIVWRQRKYIYEIYADERGEEISDYSADLILYTCESLNSSVRIFKYARLIEE